MNREAFSKIWVLIIFVILLAGGVFTWHYFGSEWKTYSNKEYEFNIQYPKDWIFQEIRQEKGSEKEIFAYINFYPKDKIWLYRMEKIGGFIPITFSIFNGSSQDFLSRITTENIKSKEETFVNNSSATKIKIVTTGFEVYQYVFDIPDKGISIIINDQISAFAERLRVYFGITEILEENSFHSIFDKMLSTFEFNKPEEMGEIIDETANWKTYRNEEYGFEMKHPEDFLPTQPLQPKTKIIQCDYANFANKCPFVPIEGFTGSEKSAFRQGFTARPTQERVTVNDVLFCRQENREGAMGTSYITYNYTTVRGKECFVVSFAVGYPNCSNYLPIENQEIQKAYDKCRLDNEVTKPETIDKIISTFRFLE